MLESLYVDAEEERLQMDALMREGEEGDPDDDEVEAMLEAEGWMDEDDMDDEVIQSLGDMMLRR